MTRTAPRPRSVATAIGASVAAAAVLVALAPSAVAADRTELVLTGTVERFQVDDFATGAEADVELTYVHGTRTTVQVPSSALADVVDGATVTVGLADSATADVTAQGVRSSTTGDVPSVEAGADVTALRVVAEPGSALTDTGAGAVVAPAAAAATHSVLVVVAKPADGTAPSVTAAALASTINGRVASYWSTVTAGAVTFSATAYGSTVTSSYNPCTNAMADTFAFWNDIKAKVGFTEGAGRHLVVYFDKLADCGGTAGLGTIGSDATSGGLVWSNGYNTTGVLGHELGHNLGLGHSQTLWCTVSGARVTDAAPSACTQKSYQDTNDIMGVSWQNQGFLNASHLRFLGVLPAGAEVAPTGSGTATLAPLASGAGARVLTLADGATRYVVELRAATGLDAWMKDELLGWGSVGVTVRREFDPATSTFSSRQSYLLDGEPRTSDASYGALHAALPVGSWVDVDGGMIGIRVVSASATSATVDYRFGPAANDQRYVAPAMPVVSSPTATLATGTVTRSRSGANVPLAWRWNVTSGSAITPSASTATTSATTAARTVSFTAHAHAVDGTVVVTTGTTVLQYRPESAPGYRWSTGWSTKSSSAALSGSVKSSTKKGATVSTTVTARSLAVLLQRSSAAGSAAVYVDGHLVAKVNLHASSTSARSVYAVRFPSVSRHTVKVVNLTGGTHGRVGVEGVVTTA